jgi:hypothetical protein
VGLSVRLRIELADRPGSLAEVAGVIAGQGGNITGIDIHPGSGSAVDEVTVEFGSHVDLREVRRAIVASGSAKVLSHQAATPVDLLTRVVRRLTGLLDSDAWDEELRRTIAELFATPAAWVLSPDEAAGYGAVAGPAEATVVRSTRRLPPLGDTIDGEAWVLAVSTVTAQGPRVIVVARPTTQGFTPTEVARLEAVAALQQRMGRHMKHHISAT